MDNEKRLVDLILNDKQRVGWLSAVHDLKLSDCWIGAGFVRNLVWDHLFDTKTPLNDIDVLFFDLADLDNVKAAMEQLNGMYPEQNWQVKNQALMHWKNQDRPYKNVLDAMSFWPEKETAVAVSLSEKGTLQISSAFGLESLFQGLVSHNPIRNVAVFRARVQTKRWVKTWPQLKIMC